MSQKISKTITYFSIIVVVIGAIFLANGLILAWSPPTLPPTGGNVPAPINVGGTGQYKVGRLQIGNSVTVWINDSITGFSEPIMSNDSAIFIGGYTGTGDSDLRLYITDDANDRFSIWGNTCGGGSCADLDAASLAHYFTTGGDVYHKGNVGIGTTAPDAKFNVQGGTDVALSGGGYIITGDLSSTNIGIDNNEIMARNNGSASNLYIQYEGGSTSFGGDITIPNSGTISSPGRMHIYGSELLYLLNNSGVIIGKEWGGTGNLSVQGDITVGGNIRSQPNPTTVGEERSDAVRVRIYNDASTCNSANEGAIRYKNNRNAGELCFCVRGTGNRFRWFCLSSASDYWF